MEQYINGIVDAEEYGKNKSPLLQLVHIAITISILWYAYELMNEKVIVCIKYVESEGRILWKQKW